MGTISRIVMIFAVLGIGCGAAAPDGPDAAPAEIDSPLVVFAVNYPLAYFAERIGGDLVEVRFPAPADEDPAYWSPDAETIAAYQAADLILLNGAGYAEWVDRATLPGSKIVNTAGGNTDRFVPLEGSTTHSHGPEGEHEHTGWASTTWLDPRLAAAQARTICIELAKVLPDHLDTFEINLTDLESDLLELDGRLATAAEAIGAAPLLFSHPVFQYLIQRYDLNAVEVHWEPDEAPDGHDWDHLEDILENHPAKWMLWEGEPLEDTAAGLEELGIGSLVFDPCANVPRNGDFATVMAENARSLETIAETLNGPPNDAPE
jgi:zinc transport system substrate-binding protein